MVFNSLLPGAPLSNFIESIHKFVLYKHSLPVGGASLHRSSKKSFLLDFLITNIYTLYFMVWLILWLFFLDSFAKASAKKAMRAGCLALVELCVVRVDAMVCSKTSYTSTLLWAQETRGTTVRHGSGLLYPAPLSHLCHPASMNTTGHEITRAHCRARHAPATHWTLWSLFSPSLIWNSALYAPVSTQPAIKHACRASWCARHSAGPAGTLVFWSRFLVCLSWPLVFFFYVPTVQQVKKKSTWNFAIGRKRPESQPQRNKSLLVKPSDTTTRQQRLPSANIHFSSCCSETTDMTVIMAQILFGLFRPRF